MMSSVSNTVYRGLMVAVALAACGKDDSESDDEGEVGGPGIASGLSNDNPLTAGSASETGGGATETDPGVVTDGDGSGGVPGNSNDSSDPKFDLGEVPMTTGGPEEVDCTTNPTHPNCMCSIPPHTPCDNGTNNLFQAMGLNCPGELQVNATSFGSVEAMGVRSNFGQAGIFNAREGSQFAVIGSGFVSELNQQTPGGDDDSGPTFCNDALQGNNDVGNLPAPIKVNPSGDCTQGQGIGGGDCSGTIQGQFSQGGGAYDYTELRFTLQVPPDVNSFSYDFAFFSTEYPWYFGSSFNDMYVGWLESEKWTGNISFDQNGNPISLNAGFLEFKDDGGGNQVLAGTCMRQHAGTNWLQTTAGVTPGETITVVFAIFDLSDPILDSYAFLDNFKWGCEPTGKPQTMPPA